MKNYRKRAAESFRSGLESPLEALGTRALREAQAELQHKAAESDDRDPDALALLDEALAHEPRDAHERRAAARAYLGVTPTRTKSAARVETKGAPKFSKITSALEDALETAEELGYDDVSSQVDMTLEEAREAEELYATYEESDDEDAPNGEYPDVDALLQSIKMCFRTAQSSCKPRDFSTMMGPLQEAEDALKNMFALSATGVNTKAISQDVQEVLSCASSARDIGENAISGGRDVIEAAESLMDILNDDLDYNAYQDASSAIGDLIDALNGVEVEQPEDGYDPETDEVAQLQQDLTEYGKRFDAMSEDDGEDEEASAGAVDTKNATGSVGENLIDAMEILEIQDHGEHATVNDIPEYNILEAVLADAEELDGEDPDAVADIQMRIERVRRDLASWNIEDDGTTMSQADHAEMLSLIDDALAALSASSGVVDQRSAGAVETKSTTEDVYALADQLNQDLTEDWNEYAGAHILMDDGDEVDKASSAFSEMKRCIREIRDTAEDIDGSLELRGLAKELASLADRGLEFYLVDAISEATGVDGSERAGSIDELIAACEGVTA